MAFVPVSIYAADFNGNPLPGAKFYLYAAGTTTPQAGYTDSTGGTAHTNPVICNAGGAEVVWLNDALSYKLILKNAADSATYYSQDNVDPGTNPTGIIIYPPAQGDQQVNTTDSPTFAGLTLTGNLVGTTATFSDTLTTADVTTAGDYNITGDITISGTVDGVDVSALKIDVDAFPDGLQSLSAGEVSQLLNINSTTVSATQWGYLGAMNQNVLTTSDVSFNTVAVAGNITVGGTVDGVDLASTRSDVDALQTEIALFDDELQSITAAEAQQLQNIDSATISSAQWAYVGGFDQALATTDDVVFATINAITFSPTGAVVGQALGYPNSTGTLEPYTPAGAGDVMAAANETVTGDWTFQGTTDFDAAPTYDAGIVAAARTNLGVYSTAEVDALTLDEDDFASDSATQPPSQQSTGVYVAAAITAQTTTVATYTALKALTPALAPYVRVSGARRGKFLWDSSDLSSTLITQTLSIGSGDIDTGTDILTSTTHGLRTGKSVIVTGGDGLTANTIYFIKALSADTFTLHADFDDCFESSPSNTLDITGTTAFSVKELADPMEGKYVIPDGVAKDGSAGAYVRQDSGYHSVLQFGAVAGGDATVNAKALQGAVDCIYALFGGGRIHVPGSSSAYTRSYLTYLEDYITIYGDGPDATHIITESSTDFWPSCGFTVGTYGGASSGFTPFDETGYNAGDLTTGTTTATLDTSGEDVNFAVGDLVAIAGHGALSGEYTADMVTLPGRGEINEVASVSSGVITFVHPFLFPYDDTVLHVLNTNEVYSSALDAPARIVRGAVLEGMTVETQRFQTQGIHLSSYECGFRNIKGKGSKVFLGNPISRCWSQGVLDLEFTSIGIELDYLNHSNNWMATTLITRTGYLASDTFSFGLYSGEQQGETDGYWRRIVFQDLPTHDGTTPGIQFGRALRLRIDSITAIGHSGPSHTITVHGDASIGSIETENCVGLTQVSLADATNFNVSPGVVGAPNVSMIKTGSCPTSEADTHRAVKIDGAGIIIGQAQLGDDGARTVRDQLQDNSSTPADNVVRSLIDYNGFTKHDRPSVASWTPTLLGSSAQLSGGTPYGGQNTGKYIDDGYTIKAWGTLDMDDITGLSGQLSIGGLPFSPISGNTAFNAIAVIKPWRAVTYPTDAQEMFGEIVQGTTDIDVFFGKSGGTGVTRVAATQADIANDTILKIFVEYVYNQDAVLYGS